MVNVPMTVKNEKLIHLRQNISSLDQQIRAKEKLAQKIIEQKQDLRQLYIEAMEKMRKDSAKQYSSIESKQDDFTSTMDRLDKEEEVINLEIKGLSEQRVQLNRSLIDRNSSLFISRKRVLTIMIILLVALSSGLVLAQRHVLFSGPSLKEGIKD